MSVTKDEIFDKVRNVLTDALGVEDEEITTEATLVGDLGAESIDFLDIVYNLEKTFDVQISRGELLPDDILTNSEYIDDGHVTADGIIKLKQRMPFADLTKFEANPLIQDFGGLLTVNDMCRFVEGKLQNAA